MFVLKGFVNHALLANNTPGRNNAIGEISNQSLTYSRELGQYVNSVAPNITLISFLCSRDGAPVTLDTDYEIRTMTIVQWIYNYVITTHSQIYRDVLLQQLLQNFQGKAENFDCGEIVSDGTYWCPEWVSWKDSLDTTDSDNFVKLWFADASFASQYDEFEIVVVPPLTNLDDFFKPGDQVEQLVNARTPTQWMDQIQQAKTDANGNTHPETIIRNDSYDYHDPLAPAHLVSTNWATLIYGIAGDNIDSIKDAIIEYILNNSTHARNEWEQIFPDIFKRTEFILVPSWNTVAIPSRVVEANPIYSPFGNLSVKNAEIASFATQYPAAHINAHAVAFGHTWRSVNVGAIGSDQNRDGLYELSQIFPDYISVPSTSTDWNRMSENTRNWAELLDRMIQVAETMGPYTSIPKDMTRLTRDGKLYIVSSYGNIHYLVAAKYNFPPI